MRRSVFYDRRDILSAVLALFGFLLYVLLASSDPAYWAGDIAGFERRDKQPAAYGVVSGR